MAAAQTSPPPANAQHRKSPFDDDFFAQNFNPGNWDPDQQFEQMRQQMDAMMQQAFNHFGKNQGLQNFFSDNGSPDISIKDEGKQYLVLVDLPGADKNNISVTLNDNQLTISGQQSHVENKTDKNGNTIFRSQQSGTFSRSVTLPGDVKPGSMHTEFNNDVLQITITKAA
jgi:HSP20 family protein